MASYARGLHDDKRETPMTQASIYTTIHECNWAEEALAQIKRRYEKIENRDTPNSPIN